MIDPREYAGDVVSPALEESAVASAGDFTLATSR
jgi:hypothetical protein